MLRGDPPSSAMRDTGNQAKYEQLLDDAGFEIRNDDKEHNDNASLDAEVRYTEAGGSKHSSRDSNREASFSLYAQVQRVCVYIRVLTT